MNKKMRELLAKIEAKTAEAKSFMAEGETKDVAKATALLDEVDALKSEFETEKRLYELDKDNNAPEEKQIQEKHEMDSVSKFARDARAGFKGMNEGTAADGGYTVPEDIQTRITNYRDAKASLLHLVRVEKVTTNKGARTFKKRVQQTGFNKVGEGAKIGAKATPQFERLEYEIDKYAGYFPVTNELLADSDANIANTLIEFIGDESRVTANKLILEQIATIAETEIDGLDGIKNALNVKLGAAFKATSKVVTNDDGLQYLDTLKDSQGKYLLSPSPADPMKLVLCAGATTVPVEVIPNADLPSTNVYSASEDTSVIAGKTYYTRTGSAGAYVYTVVANPTGNPSTSSYYEVTSYKIPVIIGDLNEGVVYWDRQFMTIVVSNIAQVGELNAFEEDLTIYRAIEREDVTLRDDKAIVNGFIEIDLGE